MTTTDRHDTNADHLGRAIAARLDAAAGDIPYDVRERLRAARVQAVAQRRHEAKPAHVLVGRGGAAALGGGEEFGWFSRFASALPLMVLAAGLVVIHTIATDVRASEVAELDAALLTDDLPPAAYADPGFVQFLKAGRE